MLAAGLFLVVVYHHFFYFQYMQGIMASTTDYFLPCSHTKHVATQSKLDLTPCLPRNNSNERQWIMNKCPVRQITLFKVCFSSIPISINSHINLSTWANSSLAQFFLSHIPPFRFLSSQTYVRPSLSICHLMLYYFQTDFYYFHFWEEIGSPYPKILPRVRESEMLGHLLILFS